MADTETNDDRNTPGNSKLAEIHAQAIKRADEVWMFENDNITQGREDQRFYAGDQWDAAAIRARGDKRPMLTVNRLPTLVRSLTGDVRQNTPAIKVLPAKGEASQEVADIENGLIRNIEAQSDADACYVIAAESAAIAGQGAFRIVTAYSDDDGFEQDIRIRPIRDPFGFAIDPMAQLPDKSDMGYAFVFERMSVDAFKAKYPDKTVDNFPVNVASGTASAVGFSWRTGDSVRVAEYWCKEPEKKTIYLLPDGKVVDQLPDGVKPTRQREVETNKVVSYLMSGLEILSGPHPWAGRHIPICVVVGEEITIDGATKRKGMVRDAKDPQRLVNYARTTEAETTALQPKAPWVVTPNEIAGYEDQWDAAGFENRGYLLFNRDKNGPPGDRPQRAQPPLLSAGLVNLSATAGRDLNDVTGIYPASVGAQSNETSGRAILAREKQGDTGTFLYPDNLRRAIAYCGRCLVDLLPKIYDNERIVRVLGEDGTHEMAKINTLAQNPETGEWQKINDLSLGEYDVVVSTGPSYLTKQQEMADSLVQLAGNMPAVGALAPDLVVKALNFPGGDELADRLTPPQFRKGPDGQPMGEQAPPPDPKVIAGATKDMATAEKTAAETEGIKIANAQQVLQLETMMSQIGQGLQQIGQFQQQLLAALSQQPGPPPGGGPPPMPPPDAMPPPPPGPPQMNGPPQMAELTPLETGQGPPPNV